MVLAALLAFHAVRRWQLRQLRLTDVRDGGLHLPDHVIPLAPPVRVRMTAYLDDRQRNWPHTANPHLFIHYRNANTTRPVTPTWIRARLGMPAHAVRQDRILDEAHATGGDVRRVCDLFGLSVAGAYRYTATAEHPGIAEYTESKRWPAGETDSRRHTMIPCATRGYRLGAAMKLKQESRLLKRKALSSLTWTVEGFNSPHDDGRVTRVLLQLQHAFEMLLKAALVQAGERVFDKTTGRSIGFERCLGLAAANAEIKLTEAETGTLRAIDAMRDDEQHWFNQVSEQLLYLHARAGITLFDDVLQRVFAERLATHLPTRVLPLSVDPPQDLAIVLDDEYTQIAALLQPGRRARHEARARIRTLLAMEAHVAPEAQVSTKDVDRVEEGIRSGDPRASVLPRLDSIGTAVDGSGITLTVHFTKKQGAPVRYVADDSVPAAAIREVDLQRKFHRSPSALASDLGMTVPQSVALREHLGIDADPACSHEFVFGKQHHRRYSDNAYTRMRDTAYNLDMAAVWEAHKPGGRAKLKPTCTIRGCQAA